jgi:RNA polymerase sigma-70 factor, ECF subfamily
MPRTLTNVDMMKTMAVEAGYDHLGSHDQEPFMTADEMNAGGTPTPESLEAVWREFSGELRQFIGRRVSRPQDADDILQLVALRMLQNSDEHRDRRTLLGWLFTVTRNAITDYYRAAVHRREVMTDDMPERPAADFPADEDTQRALTSLAACVRPLLRLLPADQAAAVELVDLTGVSQVEAARAAGLSVSGMKSRVQRGRRALRGALTACCQLQLDVRGEVQEFESRPGADCACAA